MADDKDPKKLDLEIDSQAFDNLEREVKEVCYPHEPCLFLRVSTCMRVQDSIFDIFDILYATMFNKT